MLLRLKPITRGRRPSRHARAQAEVAESLIAGGKPRGRRHEREFSRRPLLVTMAVASLVLVVLLAQLFKLQIVNGSRYAGLAEGNRLREQVVYAPRGQILDRHGAVLAANVASFQLVAFPYLLPKDAAARTQLYQLVAAGLDLPIAKLTRQIDAPGLTSSQPVLIAEHIAYSKALKLEQRLPDGSGFSLDGVPLRRYASGSGLANILGYVGRVSQANLKDHPDLSPVDFIGEDGVEAEYDQLLRGTNGVTDTEVDALGRPLRTLRAQGITPGRNLKLTIDLGLQRAFAAAIARNMKIAHVKRAEGVAVDPNTGEVLAMVSLPSYDDNLFSRGITNAAYHRLASDPNQPLLNRVIAGGYPSGSIIKPFHLAGALQEHVVTPDTVINDHGSITVHSVYDPSASFTFYGYVHSGLGPVNAVRAIALSSDIYFYTVGGGYENFKGLGVDRLTKYYKLFGLGAATGIDLPGETPGLVPTPAWKKRTTGEDWFIGDTYNISIGQGDLLVSPLQMAMATATVANGGKLLKPYILDDGSDQTKLVRQGFIDSDHLAVVREGMREVIGGTTNPAVFAGVPVTVAGKSGTAETDPKTGELPHAWYESFAPFNHPQIAFALLMEQGSFGSQFAAPAIADAMRWYFSHH